MFHDRELPQSVWSAHNYISAASHFLSELRAVSLTLSRRSLDTYTSAHEELRLTTLSKLESRDQRFWGGRGGEN